MRLARWWARLSDPRLRVLAVFLATLLASSATFSGIQMDDRFHRASLLGDPLLGPLRAKPWALFTFVDGDTARTGWAVKRGMFAWWTDTACRMNFLRPVSAMTHWLDVSVLDASPVVMHLHSLLWFALCLLVVAWVYRTILGATAVAGLASLMYALDHSHGLAAGWIAQRNTLVATLMAMLALGLHHRARARDAHTVPAGLLFGIALFCGESALGLLGYLVAHVLFLDRAPLRRRVFAFAPHALALTVWVTVYRLGRYGARGSAMYLDPLGSPVKFARSLVAHMPLGLAGELGGPFPDVYPFAPPKVAVVMVVLALVALLCFGLAIAPILRRRPEARFFAAGMCIAVIPACSVPPAGRVLFIVGFGALGLAAELARAIFEEGDRRRIARLVAIWVVGGHLVLSPLLLPLTTRQMVVIGDALDRLIADVVDDDALPKQRLVLVNAPDANFVTYILLTKAQRGLAPPRSMLVLGASTGPIEIERIDATTLLARAEPGFVRTMLDGLVRDPDNVIPVGTKIDLGDVEVEVTKNSVRNGPSEAIFRFAAPLDSELFRWMRTSKGHLVPFAVPKIGERVKLETEPMAL